MAKMCPYLVISMMQFFIDEEIVGLQIIQVEEMPHKDT
jgi:hypothetical protein